MARRKLKPYGCGIMFKRTINVVWRENVVGTRYEHKNALIMMDSQSCDCDLCDKVLLLLRQHVEKGGEIEAIEGLAEDCMYRVRLDDIAINARTGDITNINFDFIKVL